jgi:predicted nuclease with TOPRIM domain
MTDIKPQLGDLKNKVEKLINLHERLMTENKELKSRYEKLQERMEQQDRQLHELEEKNKLIKLAQKVAGSDQNTRDIKLKINEYIREIDRCLALINH